MYVQGVTNKLRGAGLWCWHWLSIAIPGPKSWPLLNGSYRNLQQYQNVSLTFL